MTRHGVMQHDTGRLPKVTAHLSPLAYQASEATMAMGQRIRTLRGEHGWPQAELATRLNADARQIGHYENRKITLSAEAVLRLADLNNLTDAARDALPNILEGLLANTHVRAALSSAG